MAVLPTFQPTAAPGAAGDAYMKTLGGYQSLMERSDANQRANQLADQRQAQFQVLQPVLQAKAQADLATAGATLTNARMLQQLRQRAALDSPVAQQEFEQAQAVNTLPETYDKDGNPIPGQPDWNGVFDTLQNLRAKYNYMGLIPEYKPFVSLLDDASAKAFTQGQTIAHIQSQQTLADIRNKELNARNAAANQARIDAATIQANATTENARTRAAGAIANTQARQQGGTADLSSKLTQALNSGDMASAMVIWGQLNGPKGNGTLAPFPYAPNVNVLSGQPYPPYVPPASGAPSQATVQPSTNPADVPAAGTPAPTLDGGTTSAAGQPPPAAAPEQSGKLYQPTPDGHLTFAPSVKTDQDKLKAVQQMVDDRVVTVDQAKKLLLQLGFTPKQ